MGVDFVKAALAAGHDVVATGRNPDTVMAAVGAHEELLVTQLDITDAQSAEQTVAAAVERFGRIEVLVNNAGTSSAASSRSSRRSRSAARSRPTCSAR